MALLRCASGLVNTDHVREFYIRHDGDQFWLIAQFGVEHESDDIYAPDEIEVCEIRDAEHGDRVLDEIWKRGGGGDIRKFEEFWANQDALRAKFGDYR